MGGFLEVGAKVGDNGVPGIRQGEIWEGGRGTMAVVAAASSVSLKLDKRGDSER
jgi:hypothetical protein